MVLLDQLPFVVPHPTPPPCKVPWDLNKPSLALAYVCFACWFWNMREMEVGHCPVSHSVFAMGSSAMIISLTLKMTSTRFHVTVEQWIAGSGWTECIPCYLSGRLVPRKRRLNTSLDFTDRKIFLFSDFLKNSFWKLWFLGLCLKEAQHRGSQPRLPCCALRSAESQNGPALFFSFSFLSLLLFPCGWVLFCFVLLVSLRRNFYWGKEPAAALPQGGGLPMNVRLKSPAKGAVQSAGHALLTGAGPEFN